MSVDIVGYSFEADTFCPPCGRDILAGRGLDPDSETARDREGNPIHAIFSTDGAGDTPDHCGACGDPIDTSWGPAAVGYAFEAVADMLKAGRRTALLDTWAEHLRGCGLSAHQQTVLVDYFAIEPGQTG